MRISDWSSDVCSSDLGAGAPPVGVVGCGIDVPYPSRPRDLWRQVSEAGLLLSETPLGIRPSAWRFPARPRVIAALAPVVVVDGSHPPGGPTHADREGGIRAGQIRAGHCRGRSYTVGTVRG